MAFSYYLSTEIIALVITKSYRDSVGVRLYINAKIKSLKTMELEKNDNINEKSPLSRYSLVVLRAFSLPVVIVISILICILILFVISLYDFHNLYYSYYHRTKQKEEDINSVFVLYCNDSTLLMKIDEEGAYQLYKDKPQFSVSIHAKRWGLYEYVEVYALDSSYSSVRLLGKA